jgi:iron complex outermembrane recepter protein
MACYLMRLSIWKSGFGLACFLLLGNFHCLAWQTSTSATVTDNESAPNMPSPSTSAPNVANDPGNIQNGQSPDQHQQNQNNEKLSGDKRFNKLFGEVSQLNDLPPDRAAQAQSPAADAVFGPEATGRKTADVGDLLKRSKSAHGVSIQHRTPITSETRVRGQRVGQVLASGSYWAPARMDLDTMMDKIDSRLIENAILVKGPYATRYGPGFRFVDLDFIHSPRYQDYSQVHGLTSANFGTNGDQWSGRQSLWGGSYDYGFHVSYGHRTGNDYTTGAGFELPTSYNSRDLFVALGKDISPYETVEVNLLRLDQTNTEFPGLVYDLDLLTTDGYELTYTHTAPAFADQFTAEFWYNRTRFEGNTLRPGKNRQIPTLRFDLFSPSGLDGFAITDGDAMSAGYRLESTIFASTFWGPRDFKIGTDIIYLNQELNDIEPLRPPDDNNFPIPRSDSVDIGLYVENIDQIGERWTVTSGARIDGVFTDARDTVDGVPTPISVLKDSSLDQNFTLGAAYLTGKYKVSQFWTCDLGVGAAMRPPTLTELYAENSFIGSLQRGLTFLEGDPQLDSEKMFQFDVGAHYDDEVVRFGAFGYGSWIYDYITYDLVAPAGVGGFPQGAAFVNTDLATLAGCEAYGQYDVNEMLTVFGNVNYLDGRDRSRNDPSRLYGGLRSGVFLEKEPLPGISPLESRLGFLIQEPSPEHRWGIEFSARIVDNQDRIATTLEEIATPGFTTFDIRTYARVNQWLFTAGVENLSDKFYREHLDYNSGLGVFRPGINFYTGAQITY